jgi:cytochrome b561
LTADSSHAWIGLLVLALVAVRIAVRLIQGAPPVEETNRLQAMAAHVTHWLFYGLLFFMPITGILTYYLGLPVGELHELGEPVFIVLIAAHVGATAWHQFVKRDGIMRRMTVPAR